MVALRQHFKYLLFIVSAAVIWAQYIAATHDQFNHHVSDDCVICKIAANGIDHANIVDISLFDYFHSEVITFFVITVLFKTSLWKTALSRAPPVS